MNEFGSYLFDFLGISIIHYYFLMKANTYSNINNICFEFRHFHSRVIN